MNVETETRTIVGLSNKRFGPAEQSALQARYTAQTIAFGPVVFQCVRYAWKQGMLQALADAGGQGRDVAELASTGRWTAYALKIALESCLSAGVVHLEDARYVLSKVGYCILKDSLTQANYDFIADVCYEGLGDLAASLDDEKPVGLQALGSWPTIYEGLSSLPEPARSSWFAFDHLYSDSCFPLVIPDVLATAPTHILDIGANTGKFSATVLAAAPGVQMHLADLPQQLGLAKEKLTSMGLADRAHYHPVDLLDDAATLPAGSMDLVWMSQLLSCFSEDAIASILRRAAAALKTNGQVLILDTFWDRQQHEIASYCLLNTSPYFTAMASGNSKIYESADYIRLCRQAGLELVSIRDGIGYSHSLLRFKLVQEQAVQD